MDRCYLLFQIAFDEGNTFQKYQSLIYRCCTKITYNSVILPKKTSRFPPLFFSLDIGLS